MYTTNSLDPIYWTITSDGNKIVKLHTKKKSLVTPNSEDKFVLFFPYQISKMYIALYPT